MLLDAVSPWLLDFLNMLFDVFRCLLKRFDVFFKICFLMFCFCLNIIFDSIFVLNVF